MHEWALAESVITAAVNEAKKNQLQALKEITIQIGELQQIEYDIFKFALQEILKIQNKNLKNVKFHIKTQKTLLRCHSCEYTWGFQKLKKNVTAVEGEAIHFIPEVVFTHARCPRCKSPDFEIIKGRGVSITSIKGSG
jgi:hydrogenase nickel incorporation protein HypA/HybF